VAASAANSQPVPKIAMSTPPAAGPPMLKKLCGSPSRLLACCSSAGGTKTSAICTTASPIEEVVEPIHISR
jgi:hypothetical protein